MSAIFGGSKQKQQAQQTSSSQSTSQSQSGNQAYPFLQQEYAPAVQAGNSATDFISQLLGLKGGDEANNAFDKYRDSSGYNFVLDQGNQNIENSAAARGMLSSGATAKALQSFGQNTAAQYYGSYLDQLRQLAGQGTQAGNIIGGAGNYANSSSTSNSTSQGTSSGSSSSKPGMQGMIGSIGASLASNPAFIAAL